MKEFLLSHNSYQVRILQEQNANLWICVHDILMIIKRPSMQSTFPLFKICPSYCKMQYQDASLYFIQLRDVKPLLNQVKNESKTINTTCEKLQEWINYLPSTIGEFYNTSVVQSSNNNELKVFADSQFGQIRTCGTNEEPLFCLADVCKVVGLKNPSSVKSRLDKEDTQLIDLHALKQTEGVIVGNSKATFVTEDGFYDVLLQSDSPKAKPFRKWVTKEVLPTIRKTGKYEARLSTEFRMPSNYPEALRELATTYEQKQQLLLEQSENKPKVEYAQFMVEEKQSFTTAQIATELNLNPLTLVSKLRSLNIVTFQNKKMIPTPGYKSWRTAIGGNARWTKEARTKILSLFQSKLSI